MHIITRINYDAFHKIGVLQQALSEQKIVGAHRNSLARIVYNRPMEPVDLGGWRLNLDFAPELAGLEPSLLDEKCTRWLFIYGQLTVLQSFFSISI